MRLKNYTELRLMLDETPPWEDEKRNMIRQLLEFVYLHPHPHILPPNQIHELKSHRFIIINIGRHKAYLTDEYFVPIKDRGYTMPMSTVDDVRSTVFYHEMMMRDYDAKKYIEEQRAKDQMKIGEKQKISEEETVRKNVKNLLKDDDYPKLKEL